MNKRDLNSRECIMFLHYFRRFARSLALLIPVRPARYVLGHRKSDMDCSLFLSCHASAGALSQTRNGGSLSQDTCRFLSSTESIAKHEDLSRSTKRAGPLGQRNRGSI